VSDHAKRPVEVTYKEKEIVIYADADPALLVSLSEGILARGREQDCIDKAERDKERERDREKNASEEDAADRRTSLRKRSREEQGTSLAFL
jgi:hypothetical protein